MRNAPQTHPEPRPVTGSVEPRPAASAVERGSALIISLMIMIILTLVGVTFLVLSEQEERISVNERDHAQTLYLAEAAAEVAKNWFNDPAPPPGNPLKPSVTQMNLTLRKGAIFKTDYTNQLERTAPASDSVINASLGNEYTGGQTVGVGATPFEKPYRGEYRVTLWGRRDTPDVLICAPDDLDVDGDTNPDCSDDQRDYLDDLNAALLVATPLRNDGHEPRDLGTVTIEQIRVYRPPVDYDLKVRYGVATIEATAVKRVAGRKVTERVVREVLQEIPFPGPAGAIETEGEVSATGSQGVHWGQVVSSSRTNDNIELPGLNNNYPAAAVPRDTGQRWGFHHTMNPASFHDVSTGPGATAISTLLSELLAVTRNGMGASNQDQPPWIADPWLMYRARQAIVEQNQTTPPGDQPYAFGTDLNDGANPPFVNGNGAGAEVDHRHPSARSHLFQNQPVRFPPIDYDTWKQVSQSGQKGMHYMAWQTGGSYKENGVGITRTWTTWINSNPNAGSTYGESGVYFFDTQNQQHPGADGDGDTIPDNLTPQHDWVNTTYAEGFIYVNAEEIRTSSGTSNVTVRANMPGEPFLDDGIDLHTSAQTTGDDCICVRYDEDDGCVLGIRPIGYKNTSTGEDCSPPALPLGYKVDSCLCPFTVLEAMDPVVAQNEAATFRNGVWDVDFDNDGASDGETDFSSVAGWSTFIANNSGGTGPGHGFPTKQLPHYPPNRANQGRVVGDWERDPRYQNNSTVYTTRQPHEPFLNLDYKTNGSNVANWGNASNPPPADVGVKVNYQAAGDLIQPGIFTTRARDNTGAAMDLDDIGINGILYNEGSMQMVGNLRVYGSLAVRAGFSGSGSVDIWFNEDLVKGLFPPASWRLPRVYASAHETN